MKPALLLLLPLTIAAKAQVFEPSDSAGNRGGNNTTVVNNGGAQQKPNQFLGNDVPLMDPGSETAQWDGHLWNVTNNRLFRARFEKYLATPEANGAQDKLYRDLLLEAMKSLAPTHPGGPSMSKAMQALIKASDHPIDARLCDSIAQAVYGVVLHQRYEVKLATRNKNLMKELRNLGWNMEVAGEAEQTRQKMETQPGARGQNGQQPPTTVVKDVANYSRAAQDIKRMVEIDANRVANAAKLTASELKSKVEFQALIVQLFLQRRFEHVIVACRLYRNLYEDGSSELQLKEGSDVEKMFVRSTGTTPTVSALDALSSEFIRDVDEGVQAFEQLAMKNDLESASKRLGEAFMIGEYLPRMRTLPLSQKDKVLSFVRDTNQLLSAIEVKDYTLAEEVVERLRKSAKDFDFSKPRAAIETARAASGMHIQSARSAAIRKDDKAVAEEIKQAALIWPTNPDLKAFSTQIAAYGDMNSRYLNDLDTLIAQNNLREIWREQIKYSGAVLGKPEYEAKLKAAIEKVGKVEKVVMTADEYERSGDRYGAWERLKEISESSKDDNEVNQRLARLSEHCAEFARTLKEAREHEDKGRLGVSLTLYLRAHKIYPNSILASAGIERLSDRILPENEVSTPMNKGTTAEVPVFSPQETDVPPPARPGTAPASR
jgi:hypothetical protein